MHMFFVSVNQVLVRLWARRRSRCLTGKSRSVEGLCLPCDLSAATFRGVLCSTPLRDGWIVLHVYVLSELACVHGFEAFLDVGGST